MGDKISNREDIIEELRETLELDDEEPAPE